MIVEEAIEDSQLWNEEGDEQEITFYRHFTSYLGTLLRNTTLKIMENPAVLATRLYLELTNNCFVQKISPLSIPAK